MRDTLLTWGSTTTTMSSGNRSISTEGLPVIVFETDEYGAWSHVNSLWSQRVQQNGEASLGFGWLDVVHPDERGTLAAKWRSLFSTREPVDLEFRVVSQGKAERWLRALAAPSLTTDGFIGVLIDTTRRRTAEAEVSRLSARSEALVASLPDLLFHCDSEGQILDFHRPANVPLFTDPTNFLGRRMNEILPPNIADAGMLALQIAAREAKTYRYEYQMLERDFEARVTPMPGGEFLFIVRDVTDLNQFEAQLISAREQALEASRLKSQFLANVSHEIRTPLNGILGVTQLLRTMALPAEAKEYLDVLQGSGESLLDIVNDVLDLSKIEANRLELESEVFDVAQLIGNATRAFAPQAVKKGLSLEHHISPAARAPSRGDPARLRQVINNLVGNALKFTDVGTIRVAVDRDGETLLLQVADTGMGIPAERCSAIFEPFVQGDGTTSRRFGGTGLGLTICRRLVQLMGGDITVESELGVGSTFRVRVHLPCVVIDRAEPSRAPRPHVQQRAMRVLLAEDNSINARLTCAIIEKLGHCVEVVTDGQQALDALHDSAFDLVLMDVQMPVVDGLEATRRIRRDEHGAHRHVPIVALTANAMRGDDLMCLSAGMDAYLPKPVTVDALKDMLVWFGDRSP